MDDVAGRALLLIREFWRKGKAYLGTGYIGYGYICDFYYYIIGVAYCWVCFTCLRALS